MNAEDAKTQSCMDEYLGKTKPKKVCPKCGKVVTEDGCGCKKGAAAKDCGTATGDAWEENKHKRAADGKFTSGGAGEAAVAKTDVRLSFFQGLGKWGVEPNLPMFPLGKDGKLDEKQQKANIARLEKERKLFDSKEAAEAYVKGLSAKPKVDSETLKKGVIGMPKEQASKIIGDYVQRKVKGVERFRDESTWNRGFFSFDLEFPKLSGKELSDKKGEISKAFAEFFPADALRMNTQYGEEPMRLVQFIDYTRFTVRVPSLRELRNNAESAKKASEMYDRIGAKLDDANEKGIKVSFAWNQEPKFSDKKLENEADKFEQLRQTYTFKANGMSARIREMEAKSVLSVVEKAYKGGEEGKAAVDAWNKSHTRKDERGIYALDEAETEAGATFDAAEDVTTVPMDVAAFDECEAKKAMEHFAKLEPIAEKKEGTCACKLKKLIAKAEKDGDKKRKDAYVHLLADANDAKIAEAQYAQKSDKDLKTLLESYKSNVASSAEWAAWAKKNGKPDNMTQEQFDAFTIRQKDYGEQMGLHVKAIERVLAKRNKDGVDVGDAWEESKHPRNHGKFAPKGGGESNYKTAVASIEYLVKVARQKVPEGMNADEVRKTAIEKYGKSVAEYLKKCGVDNASAEALYDAAKSGKIDNAKLFDIKKCMSLRGTASEKKAEIDALPKWDTKNREIKQDNLNNDTMLFAKLSKDIKKFFDELGSVQKTAGGNTKESAAAYVSKLTDEQIERGIKNANFELGKKGISESDKVVWKHGLEMLNAEKARRSKK